MSTHSVNIIEIGEVRSHDNAERLEIVPVNGWQAVVRKGEFKPGDRAIYIEPDYTVPTNIPQFAFLAKEGKERHRLKAVRLRGVLSYGLLIPVPDALVEQPVGTNVMPYLGIERYVAPVKHAGVQDSDALPEAEWPQLYAPKFDIENLQKYPDIIAPGEQVFVTEKVDGANARFVWHQGRLYLGSRSQWLKDKGVHIWKRALDATPAIRAWCEAHPDVILFGEVYGWVQALRYGAAQGEVRFAAFAALAKDEWVDAPGMRASLASLGGPMVPLVYMGPYDPEHIKQAAERDSQLAPVGHMMEGVVIVPVQERRHPEIGRVALKYISQRFWTSDN
jgi:RNA ligase (TIGR02306 family)